MQQLRNQPGIGAAALEFAILTAVRSGEVRGALWPEINISERLWLIPADNEDRKGASNSAIRCSHSGTGMDERTSRVRFVFPGTKQDKSLSDMSLTAVLKRVEHGGRRYTASDPHSGTGPVKPPPTCRKSVKWRSPIPLPVKWTWSFSILTGSFFMGSRESRSVKEDCNLSRFDFFHSFFSQNC